MNDGNKTGPFTCPAPFSGDSYVNCNKGKVLPGIATLYDAIFDEVFTMCHCCELQQEPPPPPVLEPAEQKVSLIAVGIGLLAGCLCAAMTGYHFLSRDKLKLSQVFPEDSLAGRLSARLSGKPPLAIEGPPDKVANLQLKIKRLKDHLEYQQNVLQTRRELVEAGQLKLKEEA